MKPLVDINDAEAQLQLLEKQESLTDEDLLELYDLVSQLERIGGERSLNLRKNSGNLLNRESIRRREAIIQRHDFLLNKALSGETLTEEEDRDLRLATETLLWDH